MAVSEVMNIHKRRAPFVIGGKFKLYLRLRTSRKHDITDITGVIIFCLDNASIVLCFPRGTEEIYTR